VKEAEAGHRPPIGLRTVALFEFAKGLLVFGAGVAVLALLHKDVQAEAEALLHHLRIDPALHYSQLFIEEASKVTEKRIWLGSCLAMVYAAIRFVEAYGLWKARPWAEWFAVISAGLYIPFEIYHFCRRPTLPKAALFAVNAGIVIYLARLLLANHRRKKAALPPLDHLEPHVRK
jgi:uncharacterized membrane protein (DUF2068 family)